MKVIVMMEEGEVWADFYPNQMLQVVDEGVVIEGGRIRIAKARHGEPIVALHDLRKWLDGIAPKQEEGS